MSKRKNGIKKKYVNKKNIRKESKKFKVSTPVIICTTVNFLIFAYVAFNDETIDYGPVMFTFFLFFLFLFSFGMWMGIASFFRTLTKGKIEQNVRKIVINTDEKINIKSENRCDMHNPSAGTVVFSRQLIEQLKSTSGAEIMRKKATEILKSSGKEEAFKYVRTLGYGLTQAKAFVDSIEKHVQPANLSFNIDGMEGHEFEHWCANLLKKSGFQNVEVTPASNDQGVDVLADKEGVKYAFQCKNYSTPLGNTPVQEIIAGKIYYGCDIGVVMTNSTFTKGAIELAERTGVRLWDKNKIKNMYYAVETV